MGANRVAGKRPPACNSQPWRFIVIDDPKERDAVAGAAFSGAYAMNRFACAAPVLVVVVTERSRFAARLGGMFRGVQYSLIDIGIACEHFVLQAAEESVGTCWLGWFDEKAVKRVLKLPRSAHIDVILSMGYPAADAVPRPKSRAGLEEMSQYGV